MQIATYEKAVTWLDSYVPDPSHKFPGKMGLSRMRRFAESLGNPQEDYPVILVAGTSGKGSTATLISSILSCNLNVGLHVKPHLVTVRERLQINGNLISEEHFLSLINKVKPYVEKMGKEKEGSPSYFEILVGMSYLYFSEMKVDAAVVEVGMGGLLDGTNILNPILSVVTSIGFDHVPILGKTLSEILYQKAGIIKNNCPVISGIKQPALVSQLRSICRKEKSPLFLLDKDFYAQVKKINAEGSVFNYTGLHTYTSLKLPVLGKHQVENAALAIRTIEEFNTKTAKYVYPQIDEQDIRSGLMKATIPGRMEIVSAHPLIMLDGAHNADKSGALTKSIQIIFPKKKIITVLGIKKDKNAPAILASLIRISSHIILTEFSIYSDVGKDSSTDLANLSEILKKLQFRGKVESAKNPDEAMTLARKGIGKDGMILVTGSMYLIGNIKKQMSKLKNQNSNLRVSKDLEV